MLHKQIFVPLLLSCIFILGRSQPDLPRFCLTQQRLQQATRNLCTDVSFSTDCLCLDDHQDYMLGFESSETCEDVREELAEQNTFIGVNECATRQLQAQLNLTQLEWVCEVNGTSAIYQQIIDRCEQLFLQTGDDCHRLECVTQHYNNICENLTLVQENFDILRRREMERFNENQPYIVLFNNTRSGRRQCDRTAKRLDRNRLPGNATGRFYSRDCTGPEKTLSCSLNFEGLQWVCDQRQLARVAFEEQYLNESICRNVTLAESFFFPNDTKFQNFSVVYTRSNNEQNCILLVDDLTNPPSEDIDATVYSTRCEQDTPQFDATLNYEALQFVCSNAGPSQANVVQVRNNVEPTDDSTEAPTTGATKGEPTLGPIVIG